jgi:hypothetical protein
MIAAALLGGCSKKKDAPKHTEGDGTGATNVPDKPASDTLKAELALVPVQAEAVIGADVASLRASGLYQAHEKELSGAVADLKVIKDLCGWDPVQKISSVVGGGTSDRHHGDATIVVKGLGKAETLDCLTKVASKPPEGVSVTVDGDYAKVERREVNVVRTNGDGTQQPLVAPPDAGAPAVSGTATGSGTGTGSGSGSVEPDKNAPRDSVAIQFIDDQTVVVARRKGEAVDKAGMDAVLHLDPAQSVSGSAAFMGIIDAIDTEASLWFVVNGKTPGGRALGGGLLRFEAAFGQVYVTDGLEIDATVQLKDADTAKNIGGMVQRTLDGMQKGTLKDALGPTTIDTKGGDLHVHVKESKEQLEKFVEEMGDVISSMFGG